jgi:hypothetical protein
MLPSERKLVQEVIDRINFIQMSEVDSLDTEELIMDLEEEFGPETVKWALRFLEALKVAQGARGPFRESDPMWDRDLDG